MVEAPSCPWTNVWKCTSWSSRKGGKIRAKTPVQLNRCLHMMPTSLWLLQYWCPLLHYIYMTLRKIRFYLHRKSRLNHCNVSAVCTVQRLFLNDRRVACSQELFRHGIMAGVEVAPLAYYIVESLIQSPRGLSSGGSINKPFLASSVLPPSVQPPTWGGATVTHGHIRCLHQRPRGIYWGMFNLVGLVCVTKQQKVSIRVICIV